MASSPLSQPGQTMNQLQYASISRNNEKFKIRMEASWHRTPLYHEFKGYCIDFVFSYQRIVQDWAVCPGDYIYFHQEHPPNTIPKENITIHHHVLKHPRLNKRTMARELKGICKAIARNLKPRWSLPEPYRSKMIFQAAKDTMEIIYSSPPWHDSFTLKAAVTEMIYRLIRPPSEQVPSMIPATGESIKKLECKVISASDLKVTTCVICMDELPEGYEALSMPCSHVFHGDCIDKWLRTSHYCPLCRFKMPAVSNSS